MSRQLMTEVLDHSEAIGPARLVLLAYAERADSRTREAWPGDRELIRRTKYHRATVIKARRELVARGELVPVRRRGRRHIYRIATLNQPQDRSLSTTSNGRSPRHLDVALDDSQGRGERPSYVDQSVEPVTGTNPLSPTGGTGSDFDRVKEELRAEVTDFTFHIWIEPLELVERADDVIVITAPDRVRTWVRDRYLNVIRAAARRVYGDQVDVEIPPSEKERANRDHERALEHRRRQRDLRRLEAEA